MKEKHIQSLFGKINKVVGVFELKFIKCDKGIFPPLPFDRVAAHQSDALLCASTDRGLYHKISDSFVGDKSGQRRFPSPKPFDCLYLKEIPAYVVICWYVPRKLKQFVYISIQDFLNEKQYCGRKSLTYARACAIGTVVES